MKKILIAGGTGFIGQHLMEHWHSKKISIVSRQSLNSLKNFSISNIYSWNEIRDDGIEICKAHDLIINLTGENIASKRWSPSRKKAIIQSRVNSSSLFTSLCETLGNQAPPLFNASAVGVYDLHDGDHSAYTEDTIINFSAAPNFLAEVARKWEKATWGSTASTTRIVNLRFGIVLGKNGGALSKMALPFYFGLGGQVGTGKQILSWIHIHDLIAAIEFLYKQSTCIGPINLVAPETVSQQIFAKTLAKVLHRPAFVKTPAFILKLLFGKMAEELLLKGQKVYPKKLIEKGFHFSYPTLESALKEIYTLHT